MNDDDFEFLLAQYSTPIEPKKPSDVKIEWIKNDPKVGLQHIEKHGLTKEDVEDVIFGMPPDVEVRSQRSSHPGRLAFWGPTRWKRWIFISCEEIIDGKKRILRPITAFEPDEGRSYWEKQ